MKENIKLSTNYDLKEIGVVSLSQIPCSCQSELEVSTSFNLYISNPGISGSFSQVQDNKV